MTKIEIAKKVATEMKKIRTNINIEVTARRLAKGMTTIELEKALAGFQK